jgi:[ribosomal protein S18]-alanine N-acetyltransferase
MSFVVRPMAQEDLDAVLDLGMRTPGSPHWTRGNYFDLVHLPGVKLVAESTGSFAGQIAGFAVATLTVDIADLETIVIDTHARRQGIGAALLEAVIAWCRQAHAQRLELEVRVSNAAAIALYERFGFARDGIRRSYYRDPEEDALLMGLELDSPVQTVEKNP